MRNTPVYIFLLLLWAFSALADEVDDMLGHMATGEQRVATRAMIDAGVEPEDAIRMTRAMIQNRFRNQYTLRAQQVVVAVKKENLPVGPVMDKAFEGIAKQAPDAAVVQAMEKVHERYAHAYDHARRYTRRKADRVLIGDLIAEAMTAGLEAGEVDRLMTQLADSHQQRMQESKQVNREGFARECFQTARDMMRVGATSDGVGEVIGEAVTQTRFTEGDMVRMRQRFIRQAVRGNPKELTRQYSRSIREGGEPGSHGAGAGTGPGRGGGRGGHGGGSGGGKGGGGGGGGGGGRR